MEWYSSWQPSLRAVLILALVALVAVLAHLVAFAVTRAVVKRTETEWDNLLVARLRGPSGLLVPLFALLLALPQVQLPGQVADLLRHLIGLIVIGGLGWAITATVYTFRDVILSRHDVDQADNLRARAIHTQVAVLVRIALFVIVIVAVASGLMTFERVRQVGVSLLASAGIAGIIIGFAAQRSIATLLAGVQIALTQPIRIDDVVIVEGEWGRIEEINLTYVVVAIWDQRRLVVPISYFIETPFQNWTKTSAELLGSVYLYADYRIPVEEVRKELKRVVEADPDWDGRVCALHVTNITERVVEMRALASAGGSSKAWDLRCRVREALLSWLQETYPDCLPRARAELVRATTAGDDVEPVFLLRKRPDGK